MKNTLFLLPIIFLSVVIFSCAQSSKYNLPGQVQGIISDDQLDQLKSHGLPINEGLTPPNIEGIYVADELICTYDSGGYFGGSLISDYYYKIEDQTDQNTFTFSYRTESGSDEALGKGSFISGSDQNFSLFVEVEGVSVGVPDITYKQVKVYSGTLTTEGLANWNYGFILTYKSDDPEPRLMAVNDHRIFDEQDDLVS
ncbi:MAG: hypothetical protein JXQ30_02675 [Spirochaetes bacterium]|nr:hypothetical protein [Spirochaetota bacterium]